MKGNENSTPAIPPRRDRTSASERTRASTCRRRNPSARMTAISVVRSRALMAMVLATTRTTVKRTIRAMDRTRSLTFPIISRNWRLNSFSGIAFTGASLFSNILLMVSVTRGTSSGPCTLRKKMPVSPAFPAHEFSRYLLWKKMLDSSLPL